MSQLTDYIVVLEGAIPPALCQEIIRRFDASPAAVEGKVGSEQGPLAPDFRSCLELNVTREPEWKDLEPYLTALTQRLIMTYRRRVKGCIFPEQYALEQFRIKKYRSRLNGEGHRDFFRTHADVHSYASARRFVAMLWYLNDVQQGGETRFPDPIGLDIQPKQGSVLIFPPLLLFPHSGEEPISNDKYILSTYMHYV